VREHDADQEAGRRPEREADDGLPRGEQRGVASVSIRSGPLRRDGSKSWSTMSWTCGMVSSETGNGQVIESRSPTER
jgi:hypothetical protein